MERAFLDANVLYSASRDPRSRLQQIWRLAAVEVVTSAFAIEEVRRNLEGDAQRWSLERLLRHTQVVPEAPALQLPKGIRLRDKDVPILAAAIACGATHLVTGDFRDFGPYFGKKIAGTLILPPADFLAAHRRRP